MITLHSVLRSIGFIGLFSVVTWSITHKQFDWLVYIGFPLLIVGTIYNMIDNWRNGRKTSVKIQLIILFIATLYIIIKFV